MSSKLRLKLFKIKKPGISFSIGCIIKRDFYIIINNLLEGKVKCQDCP